MNLRDLKYLVALADHKHFGRAAASCFVSQPTLSTQIRKLEEELGLPLVERAPRKVMLTPAGQEAAARARVIVSEVEQLKEAARRSRDPEAGTVRLGIFPTLGPYLLPHVIPRIRERFPELELLLVEEKSDVLLDRLREGKLDAALLLLLAGVALRLLRHRVDLQLIQPALQQQQHADQQGHGQVAQQQLRRQVVDQPPAVIADTFHQRYAARQAAAP